MAKQLPVFIQEERRKLIIGMREKEFSLQDIADVFNTTKSEIYKICGPANQEVEDN